MSSTTTEHALPIEITASDSMYALAFSANGEYLFSGGGNGVEIWRVRDGHQYFVATMQAKDVFCLAVSKNGRWIAGGTGLGFVSVWDARTFNTVWVKNVEGLDIHAVDFSSDSMRLLSGSCSCTATVWDVERGQKMKTLEHGYSVIAAKYSPNVDRIATATCDGSLHIWDSYNGCLLFDIPVNVTPWYNHGLVWCSDNIFVVSDSTIKRVDSRTGSIVSEFRVPKSDRHSCITLSEYGTFVAYSSCRTVTFSDTSAHSQVGLVEHPEITRTIAISPENRSLAIAGENGKIIVGRLPRYTVPVDPDFQIDPASLDAWENDQLDVAEILLTTAICETSNHHLVAARALVRARLGYYDEALVDADMAIKIQPSVIAYIARSLAHVGKGEKDKAYRTCDLAFQHFHSSHVTLLLIIKAIIVFIAGEHSDAISRMDDLITTTPSISACRTVQAYMYLLQGNVHLDDGNHENAIRSLKHACAQIQCHQWNHPPLILSLMSGWKFDTLYIEVRRRLCDATYAAGRNKDAGESLLEMVNSFDNGIYTSDLERITKWVSHFTHQCLSAPDGDTCTGESNTTAASLLKEWVKTKLMHDPWQDAMNSATGFTISRFTVFRVLCERLETTGRSMDAVNCFRQMVDESMSPEGIPDEHSKWVIEFRHHCLQMLNDFGNEAMGSTQYDDAVSYYSCALSLNLNPAEQQGVLVQRSKAYLAKGLWEEALQDANEVIKLDPLSPSGYESKHAALYKAGSYQDAIDALETMLARIAQSSDPETRALQRNYVSPSETKVAIRKAVRQAVRDSPRVLINTGSGRLCDKVQQAASFETLDVFTKLVSSMTTHIDDVAIERDVREHYRYGMFSHKWEDNEPLFEKVVHIVVHDLEEYPTHDKLKMFCKVIQDAGLHWAWSDTCCIDKTDHVVLQEALVAMFKWYESATLTVVFLLDVLSPSRRGDLMRSIWNTRAWTFQEYHASKVVQFYTKDWKLYLNLDISNHKESPEIISEMEDATGVSARALMALRPGLDDIREKLCLASTRQTTLVEDAAYSLLGIFSVSLPVVYGEGDQSVGRLLAQLLTSSGDRGILAWTGKSGSFNSCLPTNIVVFKELSPLHALSQIGTAEMKTITATLRGPSFNSALVVNLYDQLQDLPLPFFVGQRLKLPCLGFKLGAVSTARNVGKRVFRAQTDVLGVVEIITEEDLSRFSPLYLAHPWIDYLLDRQPVGGGSGIEMIPEEGNDGQLTLPGETPLIPAEASKKRMSRFGARFILPFSGLIATRDKDAGSLLPPSIVSEEDKRKRALAMIARLKQPFGALLLAQNPGKVVAFKRVATETLITVKLEEVTPAVLNKLMSSVRVLDVL